VRNRAATAIALVAAIAAASFLVWFNRADIVQAAGLIAGPSDAAASSSSSPDSGAGIGMATQPGAPLLVPARVDVTVPGFFSWALLDRASGKISGSANLATDTGSTESMIKVWISADYLRRLGSASPSQSRLTELSRMIRDSDDDAAEDVYQAGGANTVVQRMIKICGLTDAALFDGWWSRTEISARDAVRLGACVADGRAAGAKWTPWILGEMRQVRGEGRFGIIEALPADAAARTSIKNGWTEVGSDWHVNCLAIVDNYVLAVLTQYPVELGLQYGAGVCRNVAAQLQPR
jgi:hypothetical protein